MTSVAGSSARVSPDRRVVRRLSGWLGAGWWRGPVPITLAVAGVLHVVWAMLLATSGGDIAAQDAWAEFARAHPDVAYNLWWYGGMHPVSYSFISPYVMAWAGVRTTIVVAGTLSAGLVAWLIQRSGRVDRPMVALGVRRARDLRQCDLRPRQLRARRAVRPDGDRGGHDRARPGGRTTPPPAPHLHGRGRGAGHRRQPGGRAVPRPDRGGPLADPPTFRGLRARGAAGCRHARVRAPLPVLGRGNRWGGPQRSCPLP